MISGASSRITNVKVALVGSSGVGKSSIMQRFVENRFCTSPLEPTIGIEYGTKRMVDPDTGSGFRVQMWDTAGQEHFKSLVASYYRGVSTCILVYDVSDRRTFLDLPQLIRDIRAENEVADIVVVANKIDADAKSHAVERDEGERFARGMGFTFVEVSAKTGQNIEDMFAEVGRLSVAEFNQHQKDWDVIDLGPVQESGRFRAAAPGATTTTAGVRDQIKSFWSMCFF